jgi:tRNA dimethylallyltransferase
MRPAILIHGPTASGKTKLAIELAKRLDGEVLNADAMQVYADLDILTARPDAEERAGAPHHLFGHVDAADRYSAGRWVKDATACIAELDARGKMAVIVGGTGLYMQALTEGLSDIPPIPEEARAQARARVAANLPKAWSDLLAQDPAAEQRIEPQDRQRIARALEVLIATGKPISAFHGSSAPSLSANQWIGVALTPPRQPLYDRINTRTQKMMKAGALDEARRLWSRKLDRELPVMRAHGMPGFAEHFDGRISLEAAIERCQRDTRRYAKRQLTWIGQQFTLWPRVPSMALPVRAKVISAIYHETFELRGEAN